MADVKFDYDDDAPARTTRSMIMMIDAALEALRARGYDREADGITVEQEEDGTHHVLLAGDRVFSVGFVVDDGKLNIVGGWLNGKGP